VTSANSSDTPQDDIVAEALDLVKVGQTEGVALRLIGGVAIRVRSRAQYPSIARSYRDIDLIAAKHASNKLSKMFSRRGYAQDEQFNAMHGHFRLIYYDPRHSRQVDVFVGRFEMCHSLPIADRLDLHPITVSLADLLLSKLQIFELNDKDQRDLLALLLDHEIGDGVEAIDGLYVARLCAGDWGLWRTCTHNLDRLGVLLSQYELSAEQKGLVTARLEELQEKIARHSKSLRWQARSVVGERLQWYELPEEVER